MRLQETILARAATAQGIGEMDERAQLILVRAKDLLVRDDPSSHWVEAHEGPDAKILKRQGTYLSLAEHQLLDEGRIESVDQS